MKRVFISCVLLGMSVINGSSEALKILNWNVLYGFNHGQSATEAAEWIRTQSPDVLALQELNGLTEERLREIARAWGHEHVATHKETGFPVGLTSNAPIEVLARRVDGFHHGFLHAKTHGAHFLVVHFWPGKAHEVTRVLDAAAGTEAVFILGDFNGCSRHDASFLERHATLREIDFTFTDLVEADGFVDLTHQLDPAAKISCPTPITIPRWSKDSEELQRKQYRIDFIFADPASAQRATVGTIHRSGTLDTLSDHYPVSAQLQWR